MHGCSWDHGSLLQEAFTSCGLGRGCQDGGRAGPGPWGFLGSGVERDPASISGAEMEKNGRGQDRRGLVGKGLDGHGD